MNQIYNFSAGPAMIPISVMNQVQKELKNWNQLGCSIMEISHRSQEFMSFAQESEKDLRDLLNIPENYKVLFCQGGARGQFSAIPINLLNSENTADYINSGYWSQCAMMEAKKYCYPKNIIIKKIKNKKISLLPMSQWKINSLSEYIHYCPNETIDGLSIHEEPIFDNKIVIGDFSSVILSRIIDINKYDLIYAGSQKNVGPAGLTIIIIRENLIKKHFSMSPSILDYNKISQNNSMFNTPPTFSWYVSGLVFKWLKKKGGLSVIEKNNKIKSNLLYQTIDQSDFYINKIDKNNRSDMNVTFHLINPQLNELFFKKASQKRLYFLKGHSIIGGIRASIYNAMPLKGVETLVKFMINFEKRYG